MKACCQAHSKCLIPVCRKLCGNCEGRWLPCKLSLCPTGKMKLWPQVQIGRSPFSSDPLASSVHASPKGVVPPVSPFSCPAPEPCLPCGEALFSVKYQKTVRDQELAMWLGDIHACSWAVVSGGLRPSLHPNDCMCSSAMQLVQWAVVQPLLNVASSGPRSFKRTCTHCLIQVCCDAFGSGPPAQQAVIHFILWRRQYLRQVSLRKNVEGMGTRRRQMLHGISGDVVPCCVHIAVCVALG